ncbi:MAG: Ku domain protein [Polaromonas sp.]|nr:Ku domain protein [Polaromonas sp.]
MTTRALWKGAISFGLVHVPVALHSATVDNGPEFNWLDRRTLEPVGYKRINKVSGEEIEPDDIVKGVHHQDGQYVVLTDEEIRAAYPQMTQTISIEGFVANSEIPFIYLERPYYLEPINKGEKVYALLREAMLQTQRVGVARVVIQNRQHLAVLVPSGPGLILNLLRWGDEIRPWEGLDLPPEGAKAAGLSARELGMAKALVSDMTAPWDPHQFTDSFRDDIQALVERKVKAGQLHSVAQSEDTRQADEAAAVPFGAQILNLAELLRRSVRKGAMAGGPPRLGGPKRKPRTQAASTDGTDGTDGKPPPRRRRTTI